MNRVARWLGCPYWSLTVGDIALCVWLATLLAALLWAVFR